MSRSRWVRKGKRVVASICEEDVVREIVQRLWLQAGIRIWRINCPVAGKVRPNEPGIPDLMGYLPKHGLGVTTEGLVHPVFGTALFIEVKRRGGVRRTAQTQFIDEAVRAGCAAFFAESWDDVVRELERFGIKPKGRS